MPGKKKLLFKPQTANTKVPVKRNSDDSADSVSTFCPGNESDKYGQSIKRRRKCGTFITQVQNVSSPIKQPQLTVSDEIKSLPDGVETVAPSTSPASQPLLPPLIMEEILFGSAVHSERKGWKSKETTEQSDPNSKHKITSELEIGVAHQTPSNCITHTVTHALSPVSKCEEIFLDQASLELEACTSTKYSVPCNREPFEELDEDDLLFGLCPEDLSFSFNGSVCVEPTEISSKVKVCQMIEKNFKNEEKWCFQVPANSLSTVKSRPASELLLSSTPDKLSSADENNFGCTTTSTALSPPLLPPEIKRQQGTKSLDCGSLTNPVTLCSTPLHTDKIVYSRDFKRVKCEKTGNDIETFYGLPAKVKYCLQEYRGITKLYEWQDTCLQLPSVVNGTNLIYSLPTSGGKTLVAEIIILQQILLKGKDVLLILPFVSIVQEKVRQLTPFSTALGFAVEEYAASRGRVPPRRRCKKHVIYIATIEKANGLLNSLIELDRIASLGLVVVDELHMLGDGSSRGATLESCLTKVELVEHVKLGKHLYSVSTENGGGVNLEPVREIHDNTHCQLDPDQLTPLVMEIIPIDSCLVFCPTKKSCQNVALLLTKTLPSSLKLVKQEERRHLLNQLNIEALGICPVLSQTIPYGISYHHSGLTADERRVVEEGYLDGVLCLITCTSTLAAGVNLPAKRVILRSPFVGNQFLSRSQYKQMVGRAARSGLCDRGDSILISPAQNKAKVVSLLSGPFDSCHSSLLTNNREPLLSLILNIIGLKRVRCYSELCVFLKFTLLYVQQDHIHFDNFCQDAVTRLVARGYISVETGDNCADTYAITSLGKAAFRGCLPTDQAHQIYNELIKGQQCLILSTDIHLLFFSTPNDLCISIQPNWMVYFEVVTGLAPDELAVAELLGVKPSYLAARATGSASGTTLPEKVRLYHRFYISLILHSLLKLTSPEAIWRVAGKFHCSRGFLQSIMNSTASHASCLVQFTAELSELWSFHLLLPSINKKLAYSSSLELVPLMELSGIKQGRARQLFSAGIGTIQQLANSDPFALCDTVDNLFPKQAKHLIQAAKALLNDQAEALIEEAEELMGSDQVSFTDHR